MIRLIKIILMVCLVPSICYSQNGYWDSMIWGQDTWYVSVGSVSGTVQTDVTGQVTNVVGATVTIVGTGQSKITDGSGHFIFTGVEVGTYTVKVDMQNFDTAFMHNVQIDEDQTTSLPTTELALKLVDCGLPGDVNADGQIGLDDAINALQVTSGMRTDSGGN